ncbi:unnamed protein product [Microthlaspi erraticum]|uniref:DUF4218 domain-containing protein n=1 Tax=Microthlaspi erraticum TaxID=1685480 RepID=A0A6D2I2S1_9BRAS|nr:unnamed protein product [Microthlaspi erraticum]CAA7042361.1 unnamed protein product [Microthlaspi erraticum]
MNTVLNVQGKTKDNLNSRLDLHEYCSRRVLHVPTNGKPPVPAFRLDANAKEEFFDWIDDKVRFPDGYASNLRNCIDHGKGKFTGMKSHDCHVVMQHLLPFAFAGLLPPHVHEAIAEILCNLEIVFPPSFFDVMEHLAIYLPREAELGGPIQYRWMYPYERFMFHLKKKVKNLSRVEGFIVAQSINEETSNFAEFYFPTQVRTKTRKPGRHDDGGEKPHYPVYVPNIFSQIGRLNGKGKKQKLTAEEQNHLHMYILTNCEEIEEYKSHAALSQPKPPGYCHPSLVRRTFDVGSSSSKPPDESWTAADITLSLIQPR